jgi:hypothetical protein
MVGSAGVGEGVTLGILEAVTVGENVTVKVLFAVGVAVWVSSGVLLGVMKSCAKAVIVIALSVLCVGEGERSPVFGMTRSELYNFCAVALVTMKGKLKATRHTSSRMIMTETSIFFTAGVPF